MDSFVAIISSFPTAIYTTIMLVLGGCWLLVVLGMFDMDFLSVDIDLDVDLDVQPSGFTGVLSTLGLTGVPILIVITILFFFAWALSYVVAKYLLVWFGSGVIYTSLSIATLVGSFLLSLPITAWAIRPLRKLFRKLYGSSGDKDLMGKECKVRSLKVTPTSGEAECQTEGASLIIKVRADDHIELNKGDTAVIIDYDASNNTYQVITQSEFYSNN
ncbi:OB-fold-containig protein [Pleionea sp. CnH1-48]|uniref:OB-fold-containig protein n=1 Tax=Pleionea sp. CnH1-48 TaxID=2954494 RepID=UPI0020975EB7|nr:OB-fold-containig protein [Pleionea sp. CnH1-48]MCO7225187.1 DUF1449 family protein [Pleionea sp. CnH1-48]